MSERKSRTFYSVRTHSDCCAAFLPVNANGRRPRLHIEHAAPLWAANLWLTLSGIIPARKRRVIEYKTIS